MDQTNRNTALASAFAEELARCGVRVAAIAPGSRSSPLALALWREPGVEATVIVDERSAGFFALGAAQASGAPAAVVCTSGTAAANLHPAVCEADESAVPLLVLTADRPPELRGIGAGQTIDQLKLYGSAVRWFCEVGTHDADDAGLLHLRSTACRAFAAAAGDPRPGPVHLNLSWRDPLGPEPCPGEVTARSELARAGRGDRPPPGVRGAGAGAPPPADALVEVMAGHVAEERRGLIVCGRLTDPGLAEPIAALARAAGYPILAEPTSQLRLGPHDRSLVVSSYDAIARARPASLEPEIVLRFGELPTSKALRGWLSSLGMIRQIVVDPTYGWSEPTRVALVVLRVEARGFASGVANAAAPGPNDAWVEAWRAADGAAAAAVAGELEGVDEATEPGAHAALGRLYADGDLVYTASSMPIRDQELYLTPAPAAVRFLCNRGANGIDGLVSSGIGACAASGSPTWILTGDLGLFHDSNGLAALRHPRAPVRVVVFNNDGGGIFEFLPQADLVERGEFEALFGTPLGLDVARLAALHGLRHRRVARVAEIADAIAEGAAVIEIAAERRANLELHRRLTAAAVAAVERALA
jgi:2-succinyl-5-enolpyruvyl-6-hydroxy-3-cyclohexene-1-carboxylate synthase